MSQEFDILVIDDEDNLRQMLVRLLDAEGYKVQAAPDAKAGLKFLEKEDFLLVLLDVKLPDADGVELTKVIKNKKPETEVIVFTAFGTIQGGVNAIKNGAFDYLVKGDDNNKIIPLIDKAIQKARLQYKVKNLQNKLSGHTTFDHIIGKSAAIKQVVAIAKKVAATDTTVLLTGETGSGKEVFAQAIHNFSKRAGQPFVALNCSAFSREILESELFGHKAGAFTGAQKDKPGLVSEAEKGTLFLDEIGEMPHDLQAKLLRFLEMGEYYRIGDTKVHKANVRIVAATNRNLQKEIEAGNFREDLYYRLAAFEIPLPALNERRDDIPALIEHFLEASAYKINKRVLKATPAFIQKLQNHNWKGNIRELRNIVERACILCNDDTVDIADLPFDIQMETTNGASISSFKLQDMEKAHIARVLAHTGGNKTKAAELMGIGQTTLYAKIKEYGL